MEKNTQSKENKNSEKGQVIEMKQQRETNENDVKMEEFKAEANVKMNEQRTKLDLEIQQLKAENEKSMKETEHKYQAKMNLVDNITDAVKTTVITAGTVIAVSIMTSATEEVKLEEIRLDRLREIGE